ncbi:putative tRNA (guanine(26)-N(2))-dimethyltransferase 2 isoform X1 [Iris pallida]|uniref:tRNA (guanine(26)-N(2))-dimethyltransferase n=1 Tax=Iris pallida TaxID=29817 RepID=A0AAX6DPT1_IRIPA|nr:putative tRNA (guanine(26)-N(2))-dimethyltransferase 2 isoform X1 [Iris pallida]
MGDVCDKLKGYTIIKEGEAEILMHTRNTVFFNKALIDSLDMSIAVLRTFITKRKEEHAATSTRKVKSEHKVPEDATTASVAEEDSVAEEEKVNGDSKMPQNHPMDESENISTEPVKAASVKGHRELKAPRVLEALAASGLRALRYAREIDGIDQVVALDNDKASIEACKKNIQFNGSLAGSKVEAHLADARVYMLTHPKEFDVVDLDPYGSPSVFLDSAVQSVADGGMLMCTATDMAVLCGGNGEVCYSKYGSYPLKGKYCHEMALRILLACIESHANRYKRYIVPVLSVQMDFYIRVFVRIYTSASTMKNTPLKLSYVYQCVGCDSFHLQSLGRTVAKVKRSTCCVIFSQLIFFLFKIYKKFVLDQLACSMCFNLWYKNNSIRYLPGFGPVIPQECSDCGKKFNMGGPIWTAPMHDQDWVLTILANVKAMKERYPAYERISAVLTTISEELHDVPLFVSLHNLCATLKCTSPSAVMFRSAVINAGYRISGSHVNPLGLKFDAPMDVIWDIMRCWVKNHPVKAQPADQSGTVILSKEPTLQANFARAGASLSKAQAKKVARFLPNPERHWGPKVRAGRQITSKHVSLMGPQVLNRVNGHEEGTGGSSVAAEDAEEQVGHEAEEPDSKRQKVGDETSTQS